MSATPPPSAARLLERVLRHDPAASAILGDLREDFASIARHRGGAAARRWYWREALLLSLQRSGPARALTGALRPSTAVRRSRGRRRNEGSGPGGRLQDAGYALRNLRSNPGFALFTALVIGLGIAATTAVFSVLKPLMLAPLPFPESERLVWIANEAEAGDRESLSAITSRSANLVDFRERARSFEGLSGYNGFFGHAGYTLTGIGEPERLVAVDVVHDFLDVLGVVPLHGRSFVAEEGRFGGPRAVILSNGFWRRRFAADPTIVGRALTLNDVPHTVVGVLPSSFDFSSIFSPAMQVDLLLPFPLIGAGDAGFQGNTLHLIGRLRPGVDPRAAQEELDAILTALQEEQPERWGLGAVVTPLQTQIAGPLRAALLMLAAAAATLLLIVCVNVSNLILARSPGRAREVAVRKAFGASRRRLVRQLIAETLFVSLAGAALGSGLAWGVTRVVSRQAGIRIPLLDGVGVDAAALSFAVAAAVLTGLLAGVLPALKVAEGHEASALRQGGSGKGGGRRARRLRETLVVAEVTLACVLLVAAGLLARSFREVLSVDLGFESANAVAWQVNPSVRFETHREESDFYAALADRVASIPGVEGVGLADALPFGVNRHWPVRIVGVPDDDDDDDRIFPHIVDPGYLATLRIPLLEGRNISRDDRVDTRPVVLINESGARALFGGDEALGRQLYFWGDSDWEIVGIVQDVRHVSPESGPGIEVYFPIAQMPDFHSLDLVVRSQLPVPQVVDAVRAALREIDPSMPAREFWTLQSTLARSLSARSFTLGVIAAFGAAALLLAGLGIYGVLAHSVAERTAEIGIRLSLGASAWRLVRDVLTRTMALAGAGIAIGTIIVLLGARLLGSLVYGVGVRDPATLLIGALILLAVAMLAALVPAARAARIDPMRALR